MRLHALISVCLLSLTSGCTTPPPAPTVVTEYRNVYLPEALLADCPKTEWRGGTYRAAVALAKARGTDLDNCNAQLKAVRDYQNDLKAKESASEAPKQGL